jgi:DNA-binding LacI/PurR family transcriptional regulator
MSKRDLIIVAANFSYFWPTKLAECIKSHQAPGQIITTKTLLSGSDWGHDAENRRLNSILNASGLLGMICISRAPSAEWIVKLHDANIPIVAIDDKTYGITSIAADNAIGAQLATEYFINKGYHDLAIICGAIKDKDGSVLSGSFNAQVRLDAFVGIARNYNINIKQEHISEVRDYSYQDGKRSMQKWLDTKNIPRAVFVAAGDDCAKGVLRTALDAGLKVPEDIAIIGYDDAPTAVIGNPKLTTIKQPIRKLASIAYDMASDPSRRYIKTPLVRLLDPELIVRESA